MFHRLRTISQGLTHHTSVVGTLLNGYPMLRVNPWAVVGCVQEYGAPALTRRDWARMILDEDSCQVGVSVYDYQYFVAWCPLRHIGALAQDDPYDNNLWHTDAVQAASSLIHVPHAYVRGYTKVWDVGISAATIRQIIRLERESTTNWGCIRVALLGAFDAWRLLRLVRQLDIEVVG